MSAVDSPVGEQLRCCRPLFRIERKGRLQTMIATVVLKGRGGPVSLPRFKTRTWMNSFAAAESLLHTGWWKLTVPFKTDACSVSKPATDVQLCRGPDQIAIRRAAEHDWNRKVELQVQVHSDRVYTTVAYNKPK